jgi:hypothetical protein
LQGTRFGNLYLLHHLEGSSAKGGAKFAPPFFRRENVFTPIELAIMLHLLKQDGFAASKRAATYSLR